MTTYNFINHNVFLYQFIYHLSVLLYYDFITNTTPPNSADWHLALDGLFTLDVYCSLHRRNR
jgi:hypothetical protein